MSILSDVSKCCHSVVPITSASDFDSYFILFDVVL